MKSDFVKYIAKKNTLEIMSLAFNKEKAKEPCWDYDDKRYECPECGEKVDDDDKPKYCKVCGQRLDWSDLGGNLPSIEDSNFGLDTIIDIIDKSIAKPPTENWAKRYELSCPHCNRLLSRDPREREYFCVECGQELNWSNVNYE